MYKQRICICENFYNEACLHDNKSKIDHVALLHVV